ncbi:CBS domain-containing protein [Thermoplasmatales archaeon SCGC AB-539-N05]|nr:CBS domain-containing protein [Thermoplasmatales archaeon SCGC AB-539-N05]
MKNDVFVKEAMNTKVITAKSTITVKEAAKIMKKKKYWQHYNW